MTELLFAEEKIDCSKEEYDREVRGAVLDYQRRMIDLGKDEIARHCQLEVNRLDATHGVPPAHIDQGLKPVDVPDSSDRL